MIGGVRHDHRAARAPYPELKKSHTMARPGRPFTDVKPPPAAPVWAAIEGLARYHVLLAAIELGVFDAVRDAGCAEAGELAERLGVSPPHLASLLDGVVALGLLDKVNGRYSANDTTRRYLVSDGPACMAQLVPVAPGPQHNWTARRHRAARPPGDADRGRPGGVLRARSWRARSPRCGARATGLDRIVRYATSGPAPRCSTSVPAARRGRSPCSPPAPTGTPSSTTSTVLDVARRTTAEHGVAPTVASSGPGDYFEIDIEPGEYDLVVLGHVCRAEGADGALRLIRRAVDALRPGGRVIVADYFQDPERKLNPHAVLMGVTMMANTINGVHVHHRAVRVWLADAGFVEHRLVEPIAFQQCMIATKATRGDTP